jgi:hypothetical protein
MKRKLPKIFVSLLLLLVVALFACDDGLTGVPVKIEPPSTEIANVPPENSPANPYSPLLTLSLKGYSRNAIVKGFYVSYKSYYLFKHDSVITPPYFVQGNSITIAFPSADSLTKQVFTAKAVDNYGNIDPLGATKVYYTYRTYPPTTTIVFPTDTMTFYFSENTSPAWRGVAVSFTAESRQFEIDGYSVKVDDGAWSPWQKDTVFYLNSQTVPALAEGLHKVEVKSRNKALVEDPVPPFVYINLVKASHEKSWIVIDDTRDQNGSVEHPSDEQVDEYYADLLAGISHDNWDIAKQGVIPKSVLGKYKYVLWHCDAKAESNLPNAVGLLTDYLNTGGRLLISGWDFYDTFSQTGAWRDSIKFFGNFLSDYLHIEAEYTITEALLDSVIILDEEYNRVDEAAVDTNKIWFFRNGLHYVEWFTQLGPFTNRIFLYNPADSVAGADYLNATIGFGYHNSQYQLVVLGFPLYFLTRETGKAVFLRAKKYVEEDFPF